MISNSNTIVGIDFDNTIVGYDDIIHKIAFSKGLINKNIPPNKKLIRDSIRKLINGDIIWQKIQGAVYGPGMSAATLMDGVGDFFHRCNAERVKTFIVSHKTTYANYDITGTNLRSAAFDWMSQKNFFNHDGLGIKKSQVFFEPTREAKIERISKLGCTCFIDDLEETFLENYFPMEIHKILFDPHGQYSIRQNVKICKSWREIKRILFNENQ